MAQQELFCKVYECACRVAYKMFSYDDIGSLYNIEVELQLGVATTPLVLASWYKWGGGDSLQCCRRSNDLHRAASESGRLGHQPHSESIYKQRVSKTHAYTSAKMDSECEQYIYTRSSSRVAVKSGEMIAHTCNVHKHSHTAMQPLDHTLACFTKKKRNAPFRREYIFHSRIDMCLAAVHR